MPNPPTRRPPRHLLEHTIAIERATTSTDAAGSPARAFTTHLADQPARVHDFAAVAGPEPDRAPRRRIRCFTPGDADILIGDRIVFQAARFDITDRRALPQAGLCLLIAAEVNTA